MMKNIKIRLKMYDFIVNFLIYPLTNKLTYVY
jgi:hypothetical protein